MISKIIFILLYTFNFILIGITYFLIEDTALRWCISILSINMFLIIRAIIQPYIELIETVNKALNRM